MLYKTLTLNLNLIELIYSCFFKKILSAVWVFSLQQGPDIYNFTGN